MNTVPVEDSTRRKLLVAASSILTQRGVTALTLQEVASLAQVSKGGLLYHFASKSALISGLLDFALTEFDRDAERLATADGKPGAWTRAYIRASFPIPGMGTYETSLTAGALIGSLSLEPSLGSVYAEWAARWSKRFESDNIPMASVQLARFAVEGLWFNESIGLRLMDDAARSAFLDGLIKTTRTAS
jgi:AcrR family transcriptional regulator